MTKVSILQNLIEQTVDLSERSPSGFHPIACPVCGSDEKKGGFRFDHDKIIYNCFRASCDASCVYEEGRYVSKRFRRLMDSINVQIPADIRMSGSPKEKYQRLIDEDLYEEFDPQPITKDSEKYPEDLRRVDLSKHRTIREYVLKRRLPTHLEYYISNDFYWRDRLIIPCYFNRKLIGYIGRAMYPTRDYKYMKCEEGGSLMYFRDGRINNQISYVFEGPMCAILFPGGVASNTSTINKKMAYLLSKSKEVVLVPDRDSDVFLGIARKYGWSLCVPTWNEKDANENAEVYGPYVTARIIRENIYTNLNKAEIALKLWQSRK